MKNTTAKLLFLLIVTGALFTACARKDDVSTTTEGSLDESVTAEDLESEDDDDAPTTSNTTPTETPAPVPVATPTETPTTTTTTTKSSTYKDGTYSSTTSYNSPAGMQNMGVTLSLKGDVIQSVSIQQLATVQTCMMYQQAFSQGINSVVVGKSLASLGSIGAVNGTSLTPNGFNSAVSAIKAQAKI